MTSAPIAKQRTLPVAQFVPDEPPHNDLPVATPVRVVDPNALRPEPILILHQEFDEESVATTTKSHGQRNRYLIGLLVLLLLAILGGGGYAVYRFGFAIPSSEASTNVLPDARNGTFTRTPTAPTPPTTRRPTSTKSPTPPTPEVYGIEFVYSPTPVPTPITNVFEQAKARWQRMLIEPGVSPVLPAHSTLCGHDERTYDGVERIDDLEIWVDIQTIDGPGNVLGYAGPCGYVVAGTYRTITGEMVFDLDDMNKLLGDGDLIDVITHEIGHVLGIGSLWSEAGLVLASNSYTYTGSNGIQGHVDVGGSGSPPVELDGGAGTAYSHWDEATFGNDLMTGYISGSNNPLSRLSVRSLTDLGYIVNVNNAESYSRPGSGRRLRGSKDENGEVTNIGVRKRLHGDSLRQHTKRNFTIVPIYDLYPGDD